MANGWWIDTRDNPELLPSMMRALAGSAYLSLEGDLASLDLSTMAPVDDRETILQRQTSSPLLDWLVMPLSKESEPLIWGKLRDLDGLAKSLIHVQIEKDGRLAFCAYDNFHSECVFADEVVPLALLEELEETGVISSFARPQI